MAERLYRIGDAADLLGLKTYVLRYWETEFSGLRPVRSGKGQRRYTESNMALLTRIRYLLHEQGMTIEGVRKVLAGESALSLSVEPVSPTKAHAAEPVVSEVEVASVPEPVTAPVMELTPEPLILAVTPDLESESDPEPDSVQPPQANGKSGGALVQLSFDSFFAPPSVSPPVPPSVQDNSATAAPTKAVCPAEPNADVADGDAARQTVSRISDELRALQRLLRQD